MKTAGIIVEYNPLHYGHVYHYEKTVEATGAEAVIAVMSGNFLQRGEPAIVDKWARTQMALRMGVDLVIELPVAYAPQPAEWFAFGAVSLLEATGVVDCLCFGSESGSLDSLSKLARVLADEPDDFKRQLKNILQEGVSFPTAYSRAAAKYISELEGWDEAALSKPNNILGLHYLIALYRIGSRMKPMTIARHMAGYHQQHITHSRIASATAIRRLLFERGTLGEAAPYMPEFTLNLLKSEWQAGRAPIRWDSFTRLLTQHIISRQTNELSDIYEVGEGLEYRIKRAISTLPSGDVSVEKLLEAIKTKRYTRVKLQRVLTRILLGHTQQRVSLPVLNKGPSYLRVLGFTSKGQQLLKTMKTKATLPIITKITNERPPMLDLDIEAAQTYALAFESVSTGQLLREFTQPPIRL